MKIKMIPMVEASDMPEDVLDYCVEHEISTHYDSAVVCLGSDQDNALTNWLKENGFVFTEKYQYLAINAT